MLRRHGERWWRLGAPPEFFEYDPYTDVLHSVATPPLNASVPFVGRMLLLPTGQSVMREIVSRPGPVTASIP